MAIDELDDTNPSRINGILHCSSIGDLSSVVCLSFYGRDTSERLHQTALIGSPCDTLSRDSSNSCWATLSILGKCLAAKPMLAAQCESQTRSHTG